MAFYRICPDCGAYLDPGERCSCDEERLIEMKRKEKATAFVEKIVKEEWPASPGGIGGKDVNTKRS